MHGRSPQDCATFQLSNQFGHCCCFLHACDFTPRDLYYLAREYYYRERWQDAVDIIEQKYLPVASWMPERADAWLMMARCLWQMHRGEEARTACLQAINNNAHFKEALIFMGEMSWRDNRMMWWKMSEFADNRNVLFVRN